MQLNNPTKAGIQEAVKNAFQPLQLITVIKGPAGFLAIGRPDANVLPPEFPIFRGPASHFYDLPFPEVVSEEPLHDYQEAALWAQHYAQQQPGGPDCF